MDGQRTRVQVIAASVNTQGELLLVATKVEHKTRINIHAQNQTRK